MATTRRSLTGGSLLALLGTAALTTPVHAAAAAHFDVGVIDAFLVDAAAQASRLNHHTSAVKRACLTDDALQVAERNLRPAYVSLDAHLDAVIATPARTMEGLRAKAAIVAEWQTFKIEDDPDADLHERLAASLLRDLPGRA